MSKDTKDTNTTQKKGDTHRTSISTKSTTALTTASSDLLKVYINDNLNVKPVAEKSFTASIDAALKCCQDFLEIIQKIEPIFKLHSSQPFHAIGCVTSGRNAKRPKTMHLFALHHWV